MLLTEIKKKKQRQDLANQIQDFYLKDINHNNCNDVSKYSLLLC